MPFEPRNWTITDSHIHFFSHGFFKAMLAQRPGSGSVAEEEVRSRAQALGLEGPPQDPKELAERWVLELDRHGVWQAILIASVPEDWPSVAAALQAHPDRFAGYAMVNPCAQDAVETVERVLEEGGFRGICLFPALHRFHVYDPPALRVIEAAGKRKGLVFCHFGILKVPLREKLGVPTAFDGTYSVPTDLHRVAADFPDVVFQIPHFGAGYFRETLLLGTQLPNVVVDTSSSNNWMRLVGYPLDFTAVIRNTVEAFGPERILWGSDSGVFPRGWRRDIFDQQLACFKAAGCDDNTLNSILGKNARRLLRLPEPPAEL